MKLIGPDDNDDGLDIDMEDADTQELEGVAYRRVQIIPDRCEALANCLAHSGMDHPVIFLCDVVDPFGLAIARKVSSSVVIEQARRWTDSDENPGVIEGVDLDDLEDKEPTLFCAVKGCMMGLLGYFPVVVVARGGFTVFPFPYRLKEKSRFKLFPLTNE